MFLETKGVQQGLVGPAASEHAVAGLEQDVSLFTSTMSPAVTCYSTPMLGGRVQT